MTLVKYLRTCSLSCSVALHILLRPSPALSFFFFFLPHRERSGARSGARSLARSTPPPWPPLACMRGKVVHEDLKAFPPSLLIHSLQGSNSPHYATSQGRRPMPAIARLPGCPLAQKAFGILRTTSTGRVNSLHQSGEAQAARLLISGAG